MTTTQLRIRGAVRAIFWTGIAALPYLAAGALNAALPAF